jgi:hypothetical protein
VKAPKTTRCSRLQLSLRRNRCGARASAWVSVNPMASSKCHRPTYLESGRSARSAACVSCGDLVADARGFSLTPATSRAAAVGFGLHGGLGVCRWRGRVCRAVRVTTARRRPLLADAIGSRPCLMATRPRRRLGKSHCGWRRLWDEQERTNARNHSYGEHADNATRKI